MEAFICTACGTQYTPSEVAPRECVICEEERQYVPPRGQTWTTLAALTAGHFNSYRQYEPGLIGIGTQPQFAIGQRALVVCTTNGNVLWDCIAMLDPATIALINGLGSLKAVAISHPHFYTTMVEWSRAFGGIPIHLHADDHRWIMRPDPAIYPNLIPLSAKQVTGIAVALEPFQFDTIYGHYFDRVITSGGKRILEISVRRYVAAINGAYNHENSRGQGAD